MDFKLFGPVHLAILAAVPGAAGTLAFVARRRPEMTRFLRLCLAGFLTLSGLVWYGSIARREWSTCFPESLPLHLCDLTLWLTVIGLFSLSPTVTELAYFWGLSGSAMAVLTPDLGGKVPFFVACAFFLLHGGVVASLLFLVGTGLFRPRSGAVGRALLWLNVYLVAIGVFNHFFGTNYFYICRKPAHASLLDFLGPWTWYILSGELLAWLLFSFLNLSFSRKVASNGADLTRGKPN